MHRSIKLVELYNQVKSSLNNPSPMEELMMEVARQTIASCKESEYKKMESERKVRKKKKE